MEGGQHFKACECLVASDWSGVAFPLVAAVCTPSELVISGVDFTDSQGDKAVVDILIQMGADIEKDLEGHRLIVHGGKPLTGTQVSSHDDHRVAMAMAVCGLLADGEMKISDPECAAVSFPGFYESMNKIGAGFVLK